MALPILFTTTATGALAGAIFSPACCCAPCFECVKAIFKDVLGCEDVANFNGQQFTKLQVLNGSLAGFFCGGIYVAGNALAAGSIVPLGMLAVAGVVYALNRQAIVNTVLGS